jgi:phage terminase small subunit
MTARQRKFAAYYAASGNATQSAIRAGYSNKYVHTNASKLLEVKEVQEYIQSITEKEQRGRIISAIERQALLSDIAKNEKENINARIKAIDVLNKMTGAYISDETDESKAEIETILDRVLNEIKSSF